MINIKQAKFSEYDLWVVGSTLSGFGSNASDVDMCLVYSGKNCPIYLGNDLRIHSAKILKDFEEHLNKIGSTHTKRYCETFKLI